MRLAIPSPQTARRYGLSKNHHVRVWCECMDDPIYGAGTFSHRTRGEVLNDPRRLGSFDSLGYADLRIPGSAIALFRAHLQEMEG